MTESQEVRIKALELSIGLDTHAPVNKIVETAHEFEDFIIGSDTVTCPYKERTFYSCYNK